MFLRTVLIGALALGLAACSSTKDEAMVDQQTAGVSGDGAVGQDGYGYDSANLNGVEAGTQADLVANVGDRVFFDTDSYTLNAEARAVLEAQARWLMQYPNLTITVEGHADERGTREYNLALGDRRANAAENYLVAFGVDPRRVNTISYGKERPAVPGSYESAWSQNRRSVTKVD